MKVAFGTLIIEFSDLDELEGLAALYASHAAPASAQPHVTVEVTVDASAGLGLKSTHWVESTFDAASDTLSLTTVFWRLEMPAHRRTTVHLSMADWSDTNLDHAMRCLLQVLAPLHAGAVVMHGSAVARGPDGFAFTAHAETGKTTVARLSAELGFTVLAEELTYVGFVDGVATLFSLPVIETNRLNVPRPYSVPLNGLYRLVQAQRDEVVSMSPRRRFLEIASIATVGMRLPVVMDAVLDVVERLVDQVEPRYLHFVRSPAFWDAVDVDRRGRSGRGAGSPSAFV